MRNTVGIKDRPFSGAPTRRQTHSLVKQRGVNYPYEFLNVERRNIRLINLLPVKLNEIITCQIETVSLDDLPVYTALSYVWGDPANTRPILLDGHNHEVTVNLELALRNLGLRASEPQKFWIDALCVNQQDISERSQQVSLMNAIYKESRDAIVWLGEWDPGTPSNKAAIQRTYAVLEDLASDKHLRNIPLLSDSDDSYNESRSEFCSIMEYLISRSYWNRVWIIQEFILPKHAEIICGPFSMNRDHFIRAVLNQMAHLGSCCWSIMPLASRSLGTVLQTLNAFDERFRPLCMLFVEDDNGSRAKTLWELLLTFRTAEASDSRDKIFAFLGLAEVWPGGQPLLADYDMTSYELYTDVGLRMLRDSQSLLLLAQCTEKASYPQLPSWIPDWTATNNSRPHYMQWVFVFEHLFNARGLIPPSPMVPDGSILMLQAVKVDTITAITFMDVTTSPDIFTLVQATLSASLPVRGSTIGETSDNERLGQELLRTEISDLMGQKLIRTAMGGMIITPSDQPFQKGESISVCRRLRDEDFNVLNEFLAHVKAGVDVKTILRHPDPLYRALFGSISLNHGQKRQLLVLDQHLVGLGPQEAREGDEIWIMASSPVPIVLRPIKSNASDGGAPNGLHQLIGHCYVDGIMDGEAAENYEEKLETVRIA